MQVLFCVSVTISVADWSNKSFGCSSYIHCTASWWAQGDYSQGSITKQQRPVSMLSYRKRMEGYYLIQHIIDHPVSFETLFQKAFKSSS